MDWPLVGREVVMRRLTTRLESEEAAGVAIAGEDGVGKTRLAAELRRWEDTCGRAVEWVAAFSSAARIPFGAISGVFDLPPSVRDEPGLVHALLQAMRRRRGAYPLLLVVDDAHLLDEHSSTLIHQAAAGGAARVVLTLRHGEAAPAAITQLWKDGVVDRVEIGPLRREATDELVEAVLGGPVAAMTLTQLWQRSGGNPLFLRELVLAGLESGAFVRENGVWRAAGVLPPPTRLGDIVRARLGSLGTEEELVVEMLAVADALDLHTLELLGRQGEVERLEERRLLTIEQSGNRSIVRLAHPMYGEVVRAGLPRARARRIMRRLADCLEATRARRPEDVLRLALWRIDGGGPADPAVLLAAAHRALAVFDAPLAERLAQAAMTDAASNVPARLLLGRALASQQRVDEADDVLAAAAELTASQDDMAQIALARANLLYFRAGSASRASAVLTDALDRLTDLDWRDEIVSLLALFQSGAGELRAVAAAGRRVTNREDARPRTVVHTLVYSSVANVMLGRFAEAEREVRTGLQLVPGVREELPLSGEMLRINGVLADAYAGRLARAVELGLLGRQAALSAGAAEVAAMWGMNLAECQMLAGDIQAALRTMQEALAAIRERDPFGVHGIAAGVASVCASWLGRHEVAWALRQEILDLGLARDARSRIWLDRASVWTVWNDDGARSAAIRAIAAGRRAVGDTHLVWGAWLFHDAARLGLARPAADRLAVLARRIEGDLVPTMAHHAVALANGDAIALDRAASAFEQLGNPLLAAEAAGQAHNAFLANGRQRLARIAASRSAMLAARCPDVVTPALAELSPVALTPRELEIARLAAAGLPSRTLADRLGISVRTVDNHLGTIYSKLGVATRTDLPSVLGVTALGAGTTRQQVE